MNASAAKRTPTSRRSSEPCDDASSAQLRSPASSISRNVRWRSSDSGVVWTTSRRSPPTRDSIVPTSPGRRPAAARIEYRRNAVVVFPFVPVTAPTWSSRVGNPKNASAARPSAARASGTTSCGTGRSSSRSTISATAPSATAPAAKSCPSARNPGTQTKSVPAVTRRVSYARSATSVGAALSVRSGRTAWVKTSRSMPAILAAGLAATGSLPRPACPAGPRGTGARTARCRGRPARRSCRPR